MKRFNGFGCVPAMLLLLATSPLLAQTTQRPTSVSPPTTIPSNRGGQEPCWKQAGISQQVQQQRRQIEDNTRAEVQSVCNDSSLSQQQKQAKIRQIHQQSKQQIQGLMNQQQWQAVESCRSQRSTSGRSMGKIARGGGGGGQGPCGSLTSTVRRAKAFNDPAGKESGADN